MNLARAYETVRTFTRWHIARWQKKCINGEWPEKVSNIKESLEIYADMTIYL